MKQAFIVYSLSSISAVLFVVKHNVLPHLYFVFSWTALPSASVHTTADQDYITPTACYCVLSGPLIKTSWGSLNSCLHHCVLDLSSVLSSPPIDNNKNCVVKDPTASSIYCMLKSLDVGHEKEGQGPSEEPAYSND